MPPQESCARRGIRSWNGAKADRQPVPSIDGDDGQGQVHQFLFAEVLSDRLVQCIRHPALADPSHGFRPCERRTFALREERRFFPHINGIQPLLRFACRSGILRVHVHAVGTTVDLRGAQSHQLKQCRIETA